MKFALCILFLGLASGISFAQPMQFDTMIRDLGELKQTDAREVQFAVYNTGSDTLYLGQPRAGCGCTHVRLLKKVLAPGDSSVLSVTYTTGPHMLGEITKTIELGQMLGTQEIGVQKLRIRAEVVGSVRFSPDRLAFRATIGDSVRLRLSLSSNSAETAEIRMITPVLTAFVDTSQEKNYRADRVVSEPFEDLILTPSAESVAPGMTESVEILMMPTKRGQITGFLRITFPGSEIRIPVTGVVLNP